MTFPRIEATGGFFLLLAWLNYMDRQGIVPLCLMACLFHELGHIAVLRLLKIPIRRIRVTAVGAELSLSRALSHAEEGMASLAGPGANLILALVLSRWERSLTFAGINLALGCFNLLPVRQLDGGRALCATLSLMTSPGPAYRVCFWIDKVFIAFLLTVGLTLVAAGGNITLILVALWLCAQLIFSKQGNRTCHGGTKRVK